MIHLAIDYSKYTHLSKFTNHKYGFVNLPSNNYSSYTYYIALLYVHISFIVCVYNKTYENTV